MQQSYYQPPSQFSVIPPVIKNLLILNVLAYLVQNLPQFYLFVMQWFALWPVVLPEGMTGTLFWPWQLVTYAFLHSPFIETGNFNAVFHLLINMFVLWMFGAQIENIWGSRRFLVYYFVCVIGAGIIQLIFSYVQIRHMGGIPIPTVGASGGVFGVLLAFGMMFPNQPVYLYFLFPIKAKWLVIGFTVFSLYAGMTGAQAGVAHFAHLGGMLFGLIMILYWRGKLPVKPEKRVWW